MADPQMRGATGPDVTQARFRRPALRRALLVTLAGALAGLGHVVTGLAPLSVVALGLGFHVLGTASSRRGAFGAGWLLGVGYFAVALHWIVEPFLIDIALHGWMAPFALVLLSAGLALFWGAAALVVRAVAPSPGLRRQVALVAALGLAELARSYVLTGFPWAIPAYLWADWPQRGWVAVIGPHGLTVLTLALAGALALAASGQRGRAMPGAAALGLAVVLFGIGPRLLPPEAPLDPDRPVVRLVQPNAPQDEKWDPDRAAFFVERQIGFTATPGPRAPDLIVWPETAIPWLLDQAGSTLARVAEAAGGAPVILGAVRRDAEGFRNSLAVIGPGGALVDTYDKHHLVPFGEYMPFPALVRATGIRGIAERADGGFIPGPGARLLDLGPLGRALPLICYEAIFPQDIHAAPGRADMLIQITNDAWFGQFAGPRQHLGQARMRAVEQNLPMIRVANTGISAMIGPGGRILAEIPLGEAGFRDVALPAPGAAPPYARSGDWPVLALLLLVLGVVATLRSGNSH